MFFKTLKNIIKSKVLIIFLIISTILTAVVGCFVYGVYQNYHTKMNQGESEEKTVTVSALGNVGVQTAHKEYVEMFGKENMANEYTSVSKGDVVKMLMSLPESIMNDIECVFVGITADDNVYDVNTYDFYFTVTPDGFVPYGICAEQFTKKQYNSSEKIARLGHILFTNEASGFAIGTLTWQNDGARQVSLDEKFIEINGDKYKIIGEASGDKEDGTIYIPFGALPDDTPLRAMNSTISIEFKDPVSYRQYNEICNSVEKYLSDKAYVQEMDLTLSADMFFYKTMIFISAIVTLLFSINLVMIYSYYVERNKRTIGICRLCGCTRKRSILIFLGQALLVAVPVFILSQILFHTLIYPRMLDFFPYAINSFTLPVYILMFLSYLLISIILLTIMLLYNIGGKFRLTEVVK